MEDLLMLFTIAELATVDARVVDIQPNILYFSVVLGT